MENSFLKFQLMDLRKVKCLLFTSLPRPKEMKFFLLKEDEEPVRLKILKTSSINYISLFELELPAPYEFGKNYSISLVNFAPQPIDLSHVPQFKEFDDWFYYDGDDLGAIYYKDHTDFALWAPLATNVTLKIYHKGHYEYHLMTRSDKGVYRVRLDGDYLNAKYLYRVNNFGTVVESTDLYDRGTSANSKYSGVVDINAIKEMGEVPLKTHIKNYVDAIIYEVGIRDFTEQQGGTDVVNKGKYLGFIEEGRKTKGGHPAALDYLTFLGITHVQLNPVIDFATVDDLDVKKKYNWGYDPISFFALEGSYSLDPETPMTRLKEFKQMVNKLHEKDIGVILDVVYNHIYEHTYSHFEKIVPNYFFRRSQMGYYSNASGCGDDFASERKMGRKMIVDSMQYFVDVFGVDGYRFDLMGLLDIDTVKEGFKKCKKIKKDVMMYGEGWNMGMELPYEKKACSDNSSKLEEFGFFNDSVRDILKGPTFKDAITQKGYINGDINYAYGLKYALFGGVLDINYNARFMDANQSINYAECHDNNTLYDKLVFSNPDEDEATLLKRINLTNKLLSVMFGVPFYHMGQEIGLSKLGNDNTYNILDINKMNWSLIDERFNMVNIFKDAIKVRKHYNLYRLHTKEELESAIEYYEYEGLFIYTSKNPKLIDDKNDTYIVIINPVDKMIPFELDGDYLLVLGSSGLNTELDLRVRNINVPPISLTIFVKRKEDAQK